MFFEIKASRGEFETLLRSINYGKDLEEFQKNRNQLNRI